MTSAPRRPSETGDMRTDFGREMHSSDAALSLGHVLRERALRTARVEYLRYQATMGLLGYLGGMLFVVPAVVWLMSAQEPHSSSGMRSSIGSATALSEAVTADMGRRPSLVSVPTLADRDPASLLRSPAPPLVERPATPTVADVLTAARNLFHSGEVLAARDLLARPQVAQSGAALFMLAETYDPYVLAALGATGTLADAPAARRHYEWALAMGITGAAQRLLALD